MRWIVSRPWLAAGTLVLAAASPSHSQETGEAEASKPLPRSVTAVFGDWTTRCVSSADGDEALACEAAQYVHLPDQKQPVAQTVLRRIDNGLEMIVEVAPDVSFPGKVQVQLGDTSGDVVLDWARCLPAACVAAGTIPAEVVQSWIGGGQAGMFSYVGGNGAAFRYPISPLGLEQALQGITLE
mgnify:CR=1 FL=1